MTARDERQLLDNVATIKAQMITAGKCEQKRGAIGRTLTAIKIGLAVVYAVPVIVVGAYAVLRALKIL